MPSDEENVQYLYLVLTHGGAPTVSTTRLFRPCTLEVALQPSLETY
jgi:hypothetical protein